ncbi:hypothetical protein CMV_014030 [Castanea mollissima]|uniref:Uncharacterized protein n=1 Tax=Castanea mollissima TaxID=60419 RepID=A0A8J4QYN6_9ROSI|nr:hypothetical protein CMV_014030 [Castanea mollissima]
MAIGKKKLMSSAPWRGEEEAAEEFQDAKLKKKDKSKRHDHDDYDDDCLVEIDPQLRYSFQRNYQFLQRVFGIDTIVKPLPPAMAYNVSSNLNFFMCIVTQFFDPEGIANAQKSLGIGQEEKARRVR